MFGRIKRFFVALRILRRKARENQELRRELNLDKMGEVVAALAPKPQAEAEINTLRMNFTCGSIMSDEEADQIVEESRVN